MSQCSSKLKCCQQTSEKQKTMFQDGDIVKRTIVTASGDGRYKVTVEEYGIHMGDGKIAYKEKYRDRGRILCVRKPVFQRDTQSVEIVNMDHEYRALSGEQTVRRVIDAMQRDRILFDAMENNSQAFAIWCRFRRGPAQYSD